MGFFENVKNFFTGRSPTAEATTDYVGDPVLTALLNGSDIGRSEAMTVPTVAADVDLISSTFATLPVKLYKRRKKNGVEIIEEVKNDNRVRLLNDDTGDTLDGYQFKKALCEDYLMGKGGYAFINRSGNKVKSLHYVPCEDVSILHNSDKIFKQYQIMVDARRFEPEERVETEEQIEKVKEARSKGREKMNERGGINFYVTIVFEDDKKRAAFMRDINLPIYEEFITEDQVRRLEKKKGK